MVRIRKSGSSNRSVTLSRLLKLTALAVAYYFIARWSLLFTLEGTHSSPIWPPSGAALAAMLLLGHRIWPAILAGAFAANLLAYNTHHEITLAAAGLFLVIAIGNALEALAGYHLSRRLGIARHPLTLPQHIFKFTMMALFVCTISASTGTASQMLGGLSSGASIGSIWLNWWLGDVGGILVFLPAIVTWFGKDRPPLPTDPGVLVRWSAMLAGFAALTMLVFSGEFSSGNLHRPLLYLCIPYLAWIAFTCGRHGVSLAILLFSSIAVWATAQGLGPFVTGDLNSSLLSLVGFIVLFSITGLLLAADAAQRAEFSNEPDAAHHVGIHWLTLIAALGLTLFAWHMISNETEKTAQIRFVSAAKEINSRTLEEITHLEELLQSSAAVFAASEEVTRDEWREYMRQLQIEKRVPRIQSIAFEAWVPATEKHTHIARVRAEGYANYEIWPAGEREAYLPITYIEPNNAKNLRALGFDVNTDSARRKAIASAIDTGKLAITGKIRLVQDTAGDGLSFIIFVPIYRHDAPAASVAERRSGIYGMVSSGFRVKELMESVLGNSPMIGMEVFDGPTTDPATLMYASPAIARLPSGSLPLTSVAPMKFGHYVWTLRATSLPAFSATIDRQKAQIVLIAGFLISLLLFIVVRALTVTRESALALATHMTDALRDSESRLRSLNARMEMATEAGGIGVWDWDMDADKLIWSDWMYKIYHLSPDKADKHSFQMWHKRVHPDDIDWLDQELAEVISGRKQFATEFRIVLDDGSIRRIKANAQVVRDAGGRPRHMVGINLDITELRQAEESLRGSEERFRSIFEHAPIGMAMFSPDGHWLSANNAACDILGYDRAELERMTFQEVTFPDDLDDNLANVQLLLEGRIHSYQTEKRYIRKDKRLVWVLVTVTLLHDAAGEPLYFISQMLNIMDRKQKEYATAAALAEKEVLLKEVYHRVKNNLQVITSLLNLQMRALPEGLARTALQESSERVRAMSLVHEKLYQSSDLSSIALNDYIEDMCHQLGAFAAAAERGIELITDVEPIEIGLEIAVPLGLILNELISNSLKHGFPEGRSGYIRISLARIAPDRDTVSLKVEDNGIGLPADLDIQASPSLGLQLVISLTAQIDGKFEIESQDGTCASLVFRKHDPVRPPATNAYLERNM